MLEAASPGAAIRTPNGTRPSPRPAGRWLPSAPAKWRCDDAVSALPKPRHVWIDGQLAPADAAHLSAFDRGFQLGDGVFETLRAKAGRPTEIAAHLARLRSSAEGLGIVLAGTVEADVADGIARLLEAEDLAGAAGDAAIRVTVSRGAFFGRGLLPPADAEPT